MTTSTINRSRSDAAEAPPNEVVAENSHSPTAAISKTDSEEDAWSSTGYNYINPFMHKLQIDSNFYFAKVYVLTVLLLPLRVVGCFLSLLSAWMFACIGLCGINQDDLRTKPISGWRKQVQNITCSAMRMVYASGSFHYITMKGKRAKCKEAPILVVAPHSSYVDSILVVASGPHSIVAKRETSQIPLLGKIINFAQPIYVQREDPNSRQNTIREIVKRGRSEEDWPQVVIFSEGTCTNRKALIQFKPGAFYPGVPVQPVLLKYPNTYDTYTWTWDGPGVWRLLWLTMTKFYSNCEVEFLPVYNPSEEEKSDAKLYAQNVRQVMANALGVPTSEYSFEDVIMMSRAKDMKVPFPGDIVEIEQMFYNLDLLDSNRDIELAAEFLDIPHADKLDIITFSELLKVDLKNTHLHQLFSLLDHRHIGTVSLKSFLLCSLFCKHKNDEVIHFLRAICNIYSESSRRISRTSLSKLLKHSGYVLSQEKCDTIFFTIDQINRGHISFDEFAQYTKDMPQYKNLYKEREQIRRNFKK